MIRTLSNLLRGRKKKAYNPYKSHPSKLPSRVKRIAFSKYWKYYVNAGAEDTFGVQQPGPIIRYRIKHKGSEYTVSLNTEKIHSGKRRLLRNAVK